MSRSVSFRTLLVAGSFVFAAFGLAACSDGAESPTAESTADALVASARPGASAPADAGADADGGGGGGPASDCSSELAALNAAIGVVNAATDALNECAKNHPRSQCGPQIAAYNKAVDAYNAAAAAYNACKNKKGPVEASVEEPFATP